ncbi:MAG: ATP-binding cassette domain-containing protein, partial [Anaerolineae bacterium]|nr:ATP-binding cassette domain-containing protein [Anaerolineae bacterium]
MPDQTPALVTTSVSKNFGGVRAVRAVDLRVPVGERRALIGPNGAGKTTLFNMIAGELPIDEGQIAIFDTDITRKTVQQRARLGLGRTYQISQLFLNLTVEENLFLASAASQGLTFHLMERWRKHDQWIAWVQQVAEQVGLTPF